MADAEDLKSFFAAALAAPYPHQVSYTSAAEIVPLKLRATGWAMDFAWVGWERDAFFEEQRMRLANIILDMLALRDSKAAYLYGMLSIMKEGGVAPTAAFMVELKDFDYVVRVTEQLLAVHAFVSRPHEVGTFGVRPAVTTYSVLCDRIHAGENSKFITTTATYRAAKALLAP